MNIKELEKNIYYNDNNVEFWNNKANNFNENYSMNKYDVDNFIYDTINKLDIVNKDDTVIDIGCGTGVHAKTFSLLSKSYLGVDTSIKMIEKAKKMNKYSNISFDTIELDKIKDKYDIVFSSMCPVINSISNISKINNIANKYVIIHRLISESDEISDILGDEYINKVHNDSNYTYSLLNILYLLGYYPQIIVKEYENEISIDKYENNIPLNFKDKKTIIQKQKRALIFWKIN